MISDGLSTGSGVDDSRLGREQSAERIHRTSSRSGTTARAASSSYTFGGAAMADVDMSGASLYAYYDMDFTGATMADVDMSGAYLN